MDIWVKNVGTSDIVSIERSDIFFGPQDDFERIPYIGETTPCWDYILEGGHGQWKPTVTLKITIHLVSPLSSGTYLVKVVIPNGIFDQTTFGVE